MERAEKSYDFDSLGRDSEQPGMSGCAKVGIGCGAALLVVAIAVGIAAWWISNNVRELGADFAVTAMKKTLKDLQLPADQEARIFARIDDVARRFKAREISIEKVISIFEQISRSPLVPAGMVLLAERAYLDKSGLDGEEKAAARVTLQRFAHGAVNKVIPQQKIDEVLDVISTTNPEGKREFRHPVKDDELREFIAAAKQAADEATVPDEVSEINFADEFDKTVDSALGLKAPDQSLPAEQPEPLSQ